VIKIQCRARRVAGPPMERSRCETKSPVDHGANGALSALK
jgi:hypothetical protein